MSNTTDRADLIARVQKYLAFRDSVMPQLDGVSMTTIHDIDAGSLGHFILHDTDVIELVAALTQSERELNAARNDALMEAASWIENTRLNGPYPDYDDEYEMAKAFRTAKEVTP